MTPEHEAGRLYDAYGASLYRYALMILASREEAEDVIQQVFAALLDSGRRRIDDEERYLRRAVRNACYSALRHQKIRRGATYIRPSSARASAYSMKRLLP
jgi:RNA polymerase sigma factor (sigma-70 family)